MGMFGFFKGKKDDSSIEDELQQKKNEIDVYARQKEHPYWEHFNPKGANYSPEQLRDAIEIWNKFIDYYNTFLINGNQKFNFLIPSLECLVVLLPVVGNEQIVKELSYHLRNMNLPTYDTNDLLARLSRYHALDKFFRKYVTDEPQKQVDLVKILNEEVPGIDGNLYFYILRQFQKIVVTKQGRYNIITNPNYIPYEEEKEEVETMDEKEKTVQEVSQPSEFERDEEFIDVVVNNGNNNIIVNYAMQQNGYSPISSIKFVNGLLDNLKNVQICLSFDPKIISDKIIDFGNVAARTAKEETNISLAIKPSVLMNITEKVNGIMTLEVVCNGQSGGKRDYSVEFLAYNEWAGSKLCPEMLAAFVTPNHPYVSAVLSEASKVLRGWGKDPSFEGYQSNANRALEQIAAIYTALRKKKIVYNNPPASFEMTQRIKLPHKVLQEKKGTCMDLSVLFCACIEAAGMHPILFVQSDHVFAGCWLGEEYAFPGGYCDDYGAVTNVTVGNNCRIAMVNSVNFCFEANKTFDQSWKEAELFLGLEEKFDYVLDINVLRRRVNQPIRPIPLAMNTDIDASMFDIQDDVDIVDEEPEKLELINVAVNKPEDEGAYVKQRYWEKKLLDLSISNPLISLFKIRHAYVEDEDGQKHKVAKHITSALPIYVPDIGDLEDCLADGTSFSLRGDFLRSIRNSEEFDVTIKKALKNQEYDVNDKQEKELAIRKAENIAIDSFIKNSFAREQLFLAMEIDDGEKRLKNCAKTASRSLEENGANTLYLSLGILRWFAAPPENKEFQSEEEMHAYLSNYVDEQSLYAPLLLVPVDLERNSLTNTFTLRSRQEETQINITLLEFLKQNFNIEIEDLDPLPLDAHGVDLALILNKVRNAVKDYPFWEIIDEAYLGHFSFAKFVMWNDIHNHADEIAENKVVNSLLHGARTWTPNCDSITEDNIETISDHLNMIVPSSVDSSQMVAVATALSGESMVMQGPPGTGKSQTITNLIANALFNNKTVLFVAEKKAALDVVKRRLEGMGLGNFCLSMHSDDANKLSVLERLNKTLESGDEYYSSDKYAYSVNKVHELRARLNDIINALHTKRPYGCSLYEAITILKQNIKYKNTIGFKREAFNGIGQGNLQCCKELLREYKGVLREMGNVYDDSLNGYNGTEYSLVIREQLDYDLDNLLSSKEKAKEALQELFKWSGQLTYEQIEEYLMALSILLEAKNCLKGVIGVNDGDQIVQLIKDYLQALEKYKGEEAACAQYFDLGVLDIDFAAAKIAWEFGGNVYDGTRNRLHAELQSYAKPGVIIQESMMVYNYNYLAGIAAKRDKILHQGNAISRCLGILYNGTNTDINRVRTALINTEEINGKLNKLCANGVILSSDQIDLALGNKPLANTYGVVKAFLSAVSKLATTYSIDFGQLDEDEWQEHIFEICEHIYNNLGKLRGRTAYNRIAQKLRQAGMQPVLDAVETGKVGIVNLEAAFDGSAYYHIVMLTVSQDSRLAEFYGMKYNEMIRHYREVIDLYQELCLKELGHKLKKSVYETVRNGAYNSEITNLYKSIMNKGRNKPLRKLFNEIKNVLPKLCPCMLMNPISVAQYIDISFNKFDLVIFDEASQIPTSEAVGAMARGKDAIIVGDPKQMPPTNFFGSTTDTDADEDIKDMESLLIDCQTIQMPTKELKWHYRSQHESLIAFSNAKYYGSNLYTFPTPNDLVSEVKIVHPEGFYDRKSGTNKAEAEAIVAEIIRRYRNPELRKDSIGVIAFNTKQQGFIEDMLEKTLALPENSDLVEFNILKNVFVKNLESVQGDEADVILFSIGFAPDQNGKMLMNFGPLNRDGGWRRLNVAVSRSRKSMIIYSVLRPEQISSTVTAKGVLNLKEFLAYAENRKSLVKAGDASNSEQDVSYIIQEISDCIKNMGYEVKCNVGSSEFKMDIGIVNPYHPETYLLGILLDSENCKEAATARDRFVLQPSILRGLGWKLERLWVLDWLDDPYRIEAQLRNAISVEVEKAKAVYEEELAEKEKSQHENAPVEVTVSIADVDPTENEVEEDIETEVKDDKPLIVESTAEEVAAEEQDKDLQDSVEEVETDDSESDDNADEQEPSGTAKEDEQTPEQQDNVDPVGGDTSEEPIPQLLRINRKGPRPYKMATIKVQGTQSDYYNPENLQKIAGILDKILLKEAPINFNLLAERIMPLYGFNRTSEKFFNTLNDALDLLDTHCTTDDNRDFIWLGTQKSEAYDIYRASEDRSIDYIPAEEIVSAAYVSLKENGPQKTQNLARDVLKRFNCGKLTKKAETVVFYALDMALAEDVFYLSQDDILSINKTRKPRQTL